MGARFPPQPLRVDLHARRSPWREFAFALHQLQQAVDPALPLQEVMESWHTIIQALCECPRQRQRQMAQVPFLLS